MVLNIPKNRTPIRNYRRMNKRIGYFAVILAALIGISACQIGSPSRALPDLNVPIKTFGAPTPLPEEPTFTIHAYFTDPSITGQNSPGRAIIDALISDINAATESIDVAMYNFTLKEVSEALIKASQRGVAVRIVVDSDALQKLDLSLLKRVGIYAMGDRRESLMHNKYVIIDSRILWTGSLNLTSSGSTNDENVMVRLVSNELAGNYRPKFNEMASEDKFGPDSRSKTQKTRFDLNGIPVENYFSPEDTIDTRLVDLVGSAKESVHILAYSFTLDRLADALVKADKNGVEVRGVFDRESAEENTGADYFSLKKSGLDVHLDGESGLMHMKVIIVDNKTVAFGSYNFTASAENKNDENVLVITDEALAASFEQAFERIYTKAD
jgi:phosphatidylserine/phosphatidylglycerophosphate/cardiolipin synthase-like enzyme